MMTADNLSIESLDAKLSQLFELFDRQHRAICDIQHRLVNLESNVRNEHTAFREDCNDIFDMLSAIDKIKQGSSAEIAWPASWSDCQEASS
jgi:hypothetical protein